MNNFDIIIIGAGVSGLMAANILSKNGFKVVVLEGRDRTGGRIHTFTHPLHPHPLEAGAEFIHGNLDTTLELMKEAEQEVVELGGDTWKVTNGNWMREQAFIVNEELVIKKLKSLKQDITISTFIETYFITPEYTDLRQSLLSYVEGYYAGDPKRVSALTFLKEIESEEEQQYRPKKGYGPIINFLANKITEQGGTIQLSTIVKKVNWQKNKVEVIDDKGKSYYASRLITTIPLGVWLAKETEQASIHFSPELNEKLSAARKLGFGSVLKILITFNHSFWKENSFKDKADTGFIFSDAEVGTWWTQYPAEMPLLTGWIAGPRTAQYNTLNQEQVFEQSILSLANIFAISKEAILEMVTSWHVFNWLTDPFTKGGYAYSTIGGKEACRQMMAPINETLYFAGEALYEGTETGTVEAALSSGLRVAKEIADKV